MAEMFSSPKRPFFQSTQLMGLQPLHEEIYYEFARRFFEQKGGVLDSVPFHQVYERFGGYTWYVQAVLNRLYEDEKRVDSGQKVTDAILKYLARRLCSTKASFSFLTDNQFALLKAVAKSGSVPSPQSNAFIRQYGLPGSSSVKTALDMLMAKDLVCQTPPRLHGQRSFYGFMAEKNILEIVRTSQPLPLPKQRVDEVPQFPSFINV